MSARPGTARPIVQQRRSAVVRLLSWAAVAAAAVIVLVSLWSGRSEPPPSPAPQRLDATEASAQAREALSAGDYARAEQLAAETLSSTDRPDPELLLIAGEAATKRNRLDEALGYYGRVPDDGSDAGVKALLAAGEILRHRGEMSAAIERFRAAAVHWPTHPLPNNRLALLLGVSGQRWKSVPYLMELIRLDVFDIKLLCMLGQIDATIQLPPEFRNAEPMASDDPRVPLATAIAKFETNDLNAARSLLERSLQLAPGLVEAHARLGRVLSQAGLAVEFDRWHAGLPQEAWQHPGVWHALGLESLRRGRKQEAARCFWESARIAPEYQPANYQLGSVLKSLGRADDAVPYLRRAGLQQELAASVSILYKAPERVEDLRRAAEATYKLGRAWECRAWCQVALSLDPSLAWAQDLWRTANESIRPELLQTDPTALPTLDLSSYPLPEAQAIPRSVSPSPQADGVIAFSDDAKRVGIDFTFFKGTPPSQPSKRMHEFTGGGVGVLDYDADGRPDLFFTQGRVFPAEPPEEEPSPTDRLFRNLGNRFADVTAAAGATEHKVGFGQGAACGDFDGDGFGDVYVGNIGRERLLRNNGDGTFSDATEAAHLPNIPLTDAWTTSVVMADVSGDNLPDLFNVNYLAAPDVYEAICESANGQPQACAPNVFPACPDRLLVSDGDGGFVDRTDEAGASAPDGNGLGVVAADFDGSGRLSLFVANDQTNNHFFMNVSQPDGPARFEERGLGWGLAVDRDGRPQACMGVAADDADGDGRLDLFVTNFYLESNTLYRQLPTGGFEDATIGFGLRDPGYKMLGFGAQFLDADLDGRPGLVVTNGHVDDYRESRGIPFRMRPQVYRNLGGEFAEVSPSELGPFFDDGYLGRGLATLDWNADGREDFVISHLDSPAALLTNRSEAGNSLGVRLVATSTARDAIGTVVTAESANGTRTRQLTAGDGYQASSQRRLAFGLGPADAADVSVKWPSGRVETYDRLAAGAEWLLVEGRPAALRLASHHPRSDAVVRTASR